MHMHAHDHDARSQRGLTLGAAVTLAYVLVALVAGLATHSLALLSEAGHNFTDFLALLLSWVGVYLLGKPPNESKTWGYHRAGVLAAFVNALTLGVITVLIVVEAVERFRHPVAVHTGPMFWVAIAGLLMNAAIAWSLLHGRSDVNVRAAFLHMVGDAVSTALVVVGALLIHWTGASIIDPLLSLVIAAFILWSGWDVLKESVEILLEASPRGVRSEDVARDLNNVEGVRSVHDMHIWSLGSAARALSCHIQIADIPPSQSAGILDRIRCLLADRYHIHHTTIQFENNVCDMSNGCVVSCRESHPEEHSHFHHHHHGHAH
jgi:cobalt-zinc-cadmium efflux system protein